MSIAADREHYSPQIYFYRLDGWLVYSSGETGLSIKVPRVLRARPISGDRTILKQLDNGDHKQRRSSVRGRLSDNGDDGQGAIVLLA